MTKRFKALIYAAVVGLIIVAIFLGFLSGFANPVPWVLIAVLVLITFAYNKSKKTNEIVWKDEYSVGVKVLDQDHQKLLHLLNQFNTAYDYAMSEQFERQTLKELTDYTQYHFTREEQLMEDNEYPDLEAHKAQHKIMIEEITRLEKKYHELGHDAFEEVSQFLTNWLIKHINGTDKQYTQHLNSRGVK